MKIIFTFLSFIIFSFSYAQNINLNWAKNIGSTTDDNGLSIAVDASGNVYTTGYFEGTADFDPGAGTTTLTSAGIEDIFVSKLNASGNFVWAIKFGSTDSDRGQSITTDASGNIYITGSFTGTVDFDPGAGTSILSSSFGYEIFVVKLNTAGNLVWARKMGDDFESDFGRGIAVDASNNVYTIGTFRGPEADFDPGAGTFKLVSKNNSDDIFVSKLDASGNFVWAAALGSNEFERGNSIGVDASGNVYTTGFFTGTGDFDPGAGTADLTSAGSLDIFVSKLNSAGNFVWAKRIGSTSDDIGADLVLDPSGNVLVTGYFFGTVDFDPNAGIVNLTSAGSGDIFVTKLDVDGNFVWAKNMGGTGFDNANTIALDASGNVYTTGSYNVSADFDPGAGTATLTSAGAGDMFISKLSSTGNYITAASIGGPAAQGGNGIAIDASNNIHITGDLSGNADFDPGAGTSTLTSNGGIDIHIGKYSSGGSNITDYFHTKASGNWNAIATWESSPDNVTWTAATLTPDFNANTITIRAGHNVSVTANVTIDQTVIDNGGSVTINNGVTVLVADGAGFDLTVNEQLTVQTGGNVTLRSTATGTSSLSVNFGAISGNITTERYISNRRAWRLLGIPLSSTTQTIKAAWMEGSTAPAGYGTQVTTFSGDGRAANFDAQKPASSIRIYAAENFNSDAAHTPNTTDLITSNQAYFLFVRGDRTIDRTTSGAPASATTLRVSGEITTGSVTKGIASTNFSLIPNPYPASIDFDAIKAIAANSTINKFYVWDATLGGINGVGQYRTIDITGTAPNYTYTATPGGPNNNWRFIESGTAFMVPGSRQISFTEATKSASIPPSSMLRIASGTETELVFNLNTVNADKSTSLTDGVRLVFDNNYSARIDNDDAKKITSFNDNFGIVNGNEVLAIDKRPMPGQNDVIALKLWNTTPGNYQIEVRPYNFPSIPLLAYLKDNYSNTYTPISLIADTKVDFIITGDAGSAAHDRFSVVFGKPEVDNNPAIVIYPNPVTNGIVTLNFKGQPKGTYEVRFVNSSGQTIVKRQVEHTGGTNTQTINVDKRKGVYMLQVIKPDNSKFSQKVIIN